MIANDQEQQGTQREGRIAFCYRILSQMRAATPAPEEYRLYSNSYLAEIEKMNAEVISYLKLHPCELEPAEAAWKSATPLMVISATDRRCTPSRADALHIVKRSV